MSDCVFCKIVKGEIPCDKVYEDKVAVAFLDINPSTRGHTLVVPKKHFDHLTDMPKKDLCTFMESVQKVAKGVEAYGEGLNMLLNNGHVAGQLVPHVHFHLVPRRTGDGVQMGNWRTTKFTDMDKIAKDIKSLLKQ